MTEARVFKSTIGLPTTPGRQPISKIEATSLFPFDDGYTVYAGSCEENNPDPEGKHSVGRRHPGEVLPGGKAEVTLELPVLRLHVYTTEAIRRQHEKASGA